MIYLDNNATTQVLPEVLRAMSSMLETEYGNPSSVYQHGNRSRVEMEKARGILASELGCLPSEILFTGSGTESDNLALFGVLSQHFNASKNVVISQIEHPAVANYGKWLERFGIECREAPISIVDGKVDIQPFLDLIDEQTVLLSCMLANNETGLVLPVKDLFEAAKLNGVLCHCDAVQAFGKIPVNVKRLQCDLLSLSAHKIYGPKGVGALYLKRGTPFQAMLHGGSQENSRRPGTENVAGVVGMACAVSNFDLDNTEVQRVRDYFESQLDQVFGQRIAIHHREMPRTPNTTSVGFHGKDGNVILIKLDQQGICVSTGSACHSGALSTSSVLLRLGVEPSLAKGTLRFSFSRWSTCDDVDRVIQVLKDII